MKSYTDKVMTREELDKALNLISIDRTKLLNGMTLTYSKNVITFAYARINILYGETYYTRTKIATTV